MGKNLINALKLAGLLNEQDEPLSPPQGGPPEGEEGAGDEDPAALLDQAIELLNKIKEKVAGGGGAGPDPGADASGGLGGLGAPPPGGPPTM